MITMKTGEKLNDIAGHIAFIVKKYRVTRMGSTYKTPDQFLMTQFIQQDSAFLKFHELHNGSQLTDQVLKHMSL